MIHKINFTNFDYLRLKCIYIFVNFFLLLYFLPLILTRKREIVIKKHIIV